MRKPEISEQLINYLEERLLAGEYRPGMRIPSVRRLAAKFCLSYGSAIRGIDFLCEQGKLEKASKRGIYVCRQETPLLIGGGAGGRKIVFFIGSELDADCQSLWYTALLGFSQSASKRGDCIVMTPLPHDSDCNRVLRENAREADGLVIFNSFYWPLEPLPAGSAAVGALFDGNLDGTLSVVNLDALDAARQAVEYFRLKRVRHVVITSSSRKLFMTRGRLFAALWRSEGGSCVFSDGIPPEFDPANGYLFTSDQVCQQACEAAAETGAKPPICADAQHRREASPARGFLPLPDPCDRLAAAWAVPLPGALRPDGESGGTGQKHQPVRQACRMTFRKGTVKCRQN